MVAPHTCDNPDCGASVDAMHIPLDPIYKITIGGQAAEDIERQLWDSLPYNLQNAFWDRVSPIVVYSRLPDTMAIELAQEKDVECVRARADWSI